MTSNWWAIWVNAGYINNIMNFELSRQLQFDSIQRDNFNDFVGSELLFCEFVRWSIYIEVLGRQPDLVTNFVLQSFSSMEICIACHVIT